MGLFNWIFKGVKVETRTPKTRAEEAVVTLPEAGMLASAPVSEPEQSVSESARNAASILFERTENPLYSYGQNQQYSAASGNFSSALNGATYGNRNILVVTPRTNVEVTQVVGNLQNGDACIVCLEGLDSGDAQRRLDFLSGVICAMNGNIKRLNPNTYILTPSGIGVRN